MLHACKSDVSDKFNQVFHEPTHFNGQAGPDMDDDVDVQNPSGYGKSSVVGLYEDSGKELLHASVKSTSSQKLHSIQMQRLKMTPKDQYLSQLISVSHVEKMSPHILLASMVEDLLSFQM